MSKILNHKLFEIFFEKALIALLLFFAGVVANQSLEKYKLIETKRVDSTDVFVRACNDIWSKIYEYETTLEDISFHQITRKFLKPIGGDKLKANEIAISEKLKLAEDQLKTLRKLTDERKFIIGQDFTSHFWKYVGLMKASAEAKNNALEKSGDEAYSDREVAANLHKQALSMRFTADMAREYAISNITK